VRGFLVINERAGTESPTANELAAVARERGVETHVLREGEDAAELARTADAAVLAAAGGDGSGDHRGSGDRARPTVVVVPYGTRNHFARDLGLDRGDPLAAFDAFDGEERRVDVGRAGERRFLNNVSLGLYAALVHRRQHHRRRREALAGLRALWLSLRQRPGASWARVDAEPIRARVLLVANNAYEPSLFSIGDRKRLDGGRLHVYAAKGVLPHAWEERDGERFLLEAPGDRLAAAIDGEPVELETPLELAVERGALRVLLPRAQD
jgi:diacylglycerol kinase family enzyme